MKRLLAVISLLSCSALPAQESIAVMTDGGMYGIKAPNGHTVRLQGSGYVEKWREVARIQLGGNEGDKLCVGFRGYLFDDPNLDGGGSFGYTNLAASSNSLGNSILDMRLVWGDYSTGILLGDPPGIAIRQSSDDDSAFFAARLGRWLVSEYSGSACPATVSNDPCEDFDEGGDDGCDVQFEIPKPDDEVDAGTSNCSKVRGRHIRVIARARPDNTGYAGFHRTHWGYLVIRAGHDEDQASNCGPGDWSSVIEKEVVVEWKDRASD